jgi:hypothetical protein
MGGMVSAPICGPKEDCDETGCQTWTPLLALFVFAWILDATIRRGEPGEYCVDFDLKMEVRDKPDIPGVVLEIRTQGFARLDASSGFVLQAFCSVHRPRGRPTMVDQSLREPGEAFLRTPLVALRREL